MPLLDERQRRVLAGAGAKMLGRGGVSAVSRAAEMCRNTVITGAKETDAAAVGVDRVRREGGGRKRLIDKDPYLLLELDDLVSPDARGDPMSPLRWTSTVSYTHLLADLQSAKDLVEWAIEAGEGHVDILINNAGVALMGPSNAATEAEFDETFAVNVKVPFFLVASLAPAMAERGWGSIVNVSTMVASFGQAGMSLYLSLIHI